MAQTLSNQFNKIPLNEDEIMDYPYFFKKKKHNIRMNGRHSSTHRKRTLSIVGKDGLPIDPFRESGISPS